MTINTLIFIFKEDIIDKYSNNIIINKGTVEHFKINSKRNILSYINELCGKYNISINSLLFKNKKYKDINQQIFLNKKKTIFVINNLFTKYNNSKELNLSLNYNLNYFSDIKIIIKNKTYNCNKCILSSRSDKLNTLISNIDNNNIYLDIPNGDCFDVILEWIYTSNIRLQNIDNNRLLSLLDLSNYFNLEDLKRKIEDIIISDIINPNNIIEYLIQLVNNKKYKISKELDDKLVTYFTSNISLIVANDPNYESKLSKQYFLINKIISSLSIKKNVSKKVSFFSKESSKDLCIQDFLINN